MKILVDGFFRSGSHYIYYVFKNAYINDEVSYGYPVPHYGIDEMVKSEFSNIAVIIRNPLDTLASCIQEFDLIDKDLNTEKYMNDLGNYYLSIISEKNNVCVLKFEDLVEDISLCLNKFSTKFSECSGYVVPDSESIKEQMRIEAPNNALPSENNLKQNAVTYLRQEKFNEKNDYLNSLYNQIIVE